MRVVADMGISPRTVAHLRQAGHDVVDLLAASGDALPSVVLLRLPDMRPETLNRYIDAVLAQHAADLDAGSFLSVGERRVRVRALLI